MPKNYKRINILIESEQYQQIHDAGLSLSGLIRDLLHDRFSDTLVQLSLSPDTKKLYDHIVSNFGATDTELEPFIVQALDDFLLDKEEQIEKIRTKLHKKEKKKYSGTKKTKK